MPQTVHGVISGMTSNWVPYSNKIFFTLCFVNSARSHSSHAVLIAINFSSNGLKIGNMENAIENIIQHKDVKMYVKLLYFVVLAFLLKTKNLLIADANFLSTINKTLNVFI